MGACPASETPDETEWFIGNLPLCMYCKCVSRSISPPFGREMEMDWD